MRKYRMIRVICLLLALWMSCSALLACREEQPTPEQTSPSQGGNNMDVISLNGEWSFFRDDRAKSGTTKGLLAQGSTRDLSAGNTAEFKINVNDPSEAFYSKLRFYLSFGGEALETAGGEAPAVWAQVNDGAWFRTEIEDFSHNTVSFEHAIDLGLYFVDLTMGENTVRLRSNVTGGKIAVSEQATFPLELCYYPVLMFSDKLQPISVPGVWETQLGADYTAYDGVGWYRTTFDLPGTAADRQFVLTFEAIDYYAEIWINDRFICSHEDGYTPIVIDLFEYREFLQWTDNRLTVRVTDQSTSKDAKFPLKQTLAGFYHDSVGINFAGIWDDVYLSCRGTLRVDDVTVNPDVESGEAQVYAVVKNVQGAKATVSATVEIVDAQGKTLATKRVEGVEVNAGGSTTLDVALSVPGAQTWEVNSPVVYTANITLSQGEAALDTTSTSFGFTKVTTSGTQVIFNDRAIKLNGVLSWLGNWDQISPRFDEQVFTEQIRALKNYGFNAIKFCLVVPPEYLLDICDREGIYVYIEYPVWNPVQSDDFYERAYSQMGRMIAMGKNHPSVIMSDFNCEMQAFDDKMLDFMNWCVATGKEIDQNRLFTDNSSTGRQNYEGDTDFWTWHPYTNALGFADYAKSVVANRTAHGDKPVVFGEYADYPALADFDAVIAANGGSEPWNWSAVDDPFRADKYFASIG